MFDDQPPQDIELEKDIISISLDEQKAPNVTADVFYDSGHRAIISAMWKVEDEGNTVDQITVNEILDDKYFTQLTDLTGAPRASYLNLAYFENRLKEIADRRELVRMCMHCYEKSMDPKVKAEAIASTAKSVLDTIGMSRDADSTLIGDINDEMVESAIKALTTKSDTVGIKTGIPKLDSLLLGLQPGKLYVVAARTGVGKSALGHNFCLRAAMDGVSTHVYSTEMLPNEVWNREAACISGISTTKLKTGQPPSSEDRIRDIGEVLKDLPLRVFASPPITDQMIVDSTKKYKPSLVVVDYLQRIRPSVRNAGRHDLDIGEISLRMKDIAVSQNIPVVLLSQLNRRVEDRENKKPTQRDIKESGGVEENADVIMLLWREHMIITEEMQFSDGEITITKNRDGPPGKVRAQFWPLHCQWRESYERY